VPFGRFPFAKGPRKTRIRTSVGGRSSMVELQIVVLAVAGSNPVGHPRARFAARNPKTQCPSLKSDGCPPFGIWVLGFGISAVGGGFPPPGGMVRPLLKHGFMLNPAVTDFVKTHDPSTNFWSHILNNEVLRNSNNLEKLVVGCEIIAALDAVDLLAA
jgi:hypothetical protein